MAFTETDPLTPFEDILNAMVAAANDRIQVGVETITPVVNIPTYVQVTFATPFAVIPYVYPGLDSQFPGAAVSGVSVSHRTTTGFRLWVTRNTNTPTIVQWAAIVP